LQIIFFVFLILMLILASAVAMWYDTLKIHASIETGSVDVEFGDVWCEETPEAEGKDVGSCSVELKEIEEAIKPSGLWKSKARTIVELAKLVVSKGGEEYLLKENSFVLREELLKVRGVGPKTVDVFLSFVRKAPVFAVDTHAMRIALRWGLVERRDYKEVSRSLLECFGAELSDEAHRLLIALGRTYCKARSPRCRECPVREHCPSSKA
ncbi:MAG: hypothetical protein QXM56_04465, partial [Acidilobaceae archaeon]